MSSDTLTHLAWDVNALRNELLWELSTGQAYYG